MNIDASGEQITNIQDIFRTLKSLELKRSQLTLKLPGDRNSYASLILHTDLKQRQFIIDEVNHEHGNERLISGAPFTFVAFFEGVQVIFKGRVNSKGPRNFSNAFSVDFPPYIYHKQRRNAYRAALDAQASAQIQLHSDKRGQPLQGQLIDLSSTGAGCRFSGYIKPEIKKREYFERCTLRVNGEFELQCAVVARAPVYHRILDNCSCGLEFVNLDRFQQKALDRYVLTIQRQARRKRDQHSRLASVV